MELPTEPESDMPEPSELAVVEKPKRLSDADAASVPALVRNAGDRATWRPLALCTRRIWRERVLHCDLWCPYNPVSSQTAG